MRKPDGVLSTHTFAFKQLTAQKSEPVNPVIAGGAIRNLDSFRYAAATAESGASTRRPFVYAASTLRRTLSQYSNNAYWQAFFNVHGIHGAAWQMRGQYMQAYIMTYKFSGLTQLLWTLIAFSLCYLLLGLQMRPAAIWRQLGQLVQKTRRVALQTANNLDTAIRQRHAVTSLATAMLFSFMTITSMASWVNISDASDDNLLPGDFGDATNDLIGSYFFDSYVRLPKTSMSFSGAGRMRPVGLVAHPVHASDSANQRRNHLQSNYLVTAKDGTVVTRYVYLPYGRLNRELTDTDADNNGKQFLISQKYTGQAHCTTNHFFEVQCEPEHLPMAGVQTTIYDYETGFYNYKARMYDPETARFLQTDPRHKDMAGWSNFDRYGYVHGSPIVMTDPSGEVGVLAAMMGGLKWAIAGITGGFQLAATAGDWRNFTATNAMNGVNWGVEQISNGYNRLVHGKNYHCHSGQACRLGLSNKSWDKFWNSNFFGKIFYNIYKFYKYVAVQTSAWWETVQHSWKPSYEEKVIADVFIEIACDQGDDNACLLARYMTNEYTRKKKKNHRRKQWGIFEDIGTGHPSASYDNHPGHSIGNMFVAACAHYISSQPVAQYNSPSPEIVQWVPFENFQTIGGLYCMAGGILIDMSQ
ncbi:MAG: RHS repeat-associated core domain-containing protein [Leptospiraceae bacterium]|nr:RHS repeat-associated core domain-containing protein [Leptospiraceae bacterium]